MEELLSPAEVAKRLGVSPVTVRSWVAKGWLTSHLTPGGHRRFRWQDVEDLLLKRNQSRPLPNPATTPATILVVDDDSQFRSFLIEALGVLVPDAIVREAADGFQAGIEIANLRPGLVLLDYAMPGLNGVDVCALIRNESIYSNTRIVAITGHINDDIQNALIKAGANLVLHKPLTLNDIEDTLGQFNLLNNSVND